MKKTNKNNENNKPQTVKYIYTKENWRKQTLKQQGKWWTNTMHFFSKKDKNHEKKHTTIMKTIGKILKIDENSKENNEKKHIVK